MADMDDANNFYLEVPVLAGSGSGAKQLLGWACRTGLPAVSSDRLMTEMTMLAFHEEREKTMIVRNEKQVVIVARFLAKEGRENDLLEALQVLMVPTRAEDGCIRYELNQQADNARVLTYIEKFRDQSAIDVHASSEYITGFFKNTAPGLAETIDVTYHREILV